ncbi:MAG: aminoacyl-tRNA hydrolase [Patescibacteria group bacterium]|jgi:PTH1 family peptidyl-tRNA hydrolase
MQIIVGLGNPGEQYEYTRHNAGFMALNVLAERLGLVWKTNKKFKAETAEGQNLILVKPLDFMNNSGLPVSAVLSYYKLLPKKLGILKTKNADLSEILTVIHDDLDIELGKYKISLDSRSAGHRGVQSIIDQLKTKNFQRIRIGIKTPPLEKIPANLARRNEVEAAKFVLQKFNKEEEKTINQLIPKATKKL